MMRLFLYRSGAFLFAVVVLLGTLVDLRARTHDPERMLRLGRDAHRRTDWDAADRRADQLIILNHREHSRLLRGETLFHQKKHASAVDILNRIRDEGDLRVQGVLIQARCMMELGSPREADNAFRYVLSVRPDDVDALRGIAAVTYDQGMWLHTEQYLRRLVDLLPDDGRPAWTLGMIYRDMSQNKDAEQYLRLALTRPLPGEAPYRVRADLAAVLTARKQFDQAFEVTEPIPAADRSATIWQLRVDSLRSMNRLTEADEEARRAFQLFPDHAELLAELGLVQLDRGFPDEAIRLLEQSLQRDPHLVRARQGLSRAYQSVGRTSDASLQQDKIAETERSFKELTELTTQAMDKPWDASVRRQLSQVCRQLGKIELARSWAMAAAACEQR